MTQTKRLFSTVLIAGGLAISLLQTAYSQQSGRKTLAPLISGSQNACALGQLETKTSAPLETVSINSGTVSRNVVIQFSAETFVNFGDQMNLDYSIDGGVPVAIGPEFFSSDTHEATRTAIGVIKLGPGTHTIQPVISSVTGSGVTVEIRCLTVEGQTK
jgi:hypothetical protein